MLTRARIKVQSGYYYYYYLLPFIDKRKSLVKIQRDSEQSLLKFFESLEFPYSLRGILTFNGDYTIQENAFEC
jgi:hypothetical protein